MLQYTMEGKGRDEGSFLSCASSSPARVTMSPLTAYSHSRTAPLIVDRCTGGARYRGKGCPWLLALSVSGWGVEGEGAGEDAGEEEGDAEGWGDVVPALVWRGRSFRSGSGEGGVSEGRWEREETPQRKASVAALRCCGLLAVALNARGNIVVDHTS